MSGFGSLNVSFPGVSEAEKSRLASSLRDALSGVQGVEASVEKTNKNSQDPGTILTIVLTAPAVIAAVTALNAWLVRSNQGGVTVTTPEGRVVMSNLDSKDMPSAIEAVKAALSR